MKTKKEQIRDYLYNERPVDNIGLVNELVNWCNKHDKVLLSYKAARVYAKCMAKGKLEIAQSIKAKYRFPKEDDLITSLSIALLARK